MAWDYILISLFIGIIIGAIIMYFSNIYILNKKQYIKNNTEDDKKKIKKHYEELENHFIHSAKLLDNITHEYFTYFQYMIKSSSKLLPEIKKENNPFYKSLSQLKTSSDQITIQVPRDYSESTSSLIQNGINYD